MSVEIRNLQKSFGNQRVLDSVSLTVRENEIVCLTGVSGVGKTTLLLLLAGLMKPDAGEIFGTSEKRISMMFQENRLLPWADAQTNVLAVLDRKKAARLKPVLKDEFFAVGLSDYEGKPVARLSGGMQRRVALVRAMCAESDLVLLDEPFTGLDAKSKERAIKYILSKKEDRSIVLTSHDCEAAGMLRARIVELSSSEVYHE